MSLARFPDDNGELDNEEDFTGQDESMLNTDEKQDLKANLEHLATFGTSLRRRAKRTAVSQRTAVSGTNTDASQASAKKMKNVDVLHSEDYHLYSAALLQGSAVSTWPVGQQQDHRYASSKDVDWDEMHGDGINPVSFTKNMLGSNSPSLDAPVSSGDLALDDVPYALIQRCWERAVHAASSTIPFQTKGAVGVNCGEGSIQAGVASQNVTSHVSSAQLPRSETTVHAGTEVLSAIDVRQIQDKDSPQPELIESAARNNDSPPPSGKPKSVSWGEEARNNLAEFGQARDSDEKTLKPVELCSALNIAFHSEKNEDEKFECQVCAEEFVGSELLRQHFYFGLGSRHGDCHVGAGCCWNLVKDKQKQRVHQILSQEFVNIVDGLLHVLLSRAKKAGQSKDEMFDLKDVLKFFREELGTSTERRSTKQSEDPSSNNLSTRLLETLDVCPDILPFVLNDEIIRILSSRLSDRYAKFRR